MKHSTLTQKQRGWVQMIIYMPKKWKHKLRKIALKKSEGEEFNVSVAMLVRQILQEKFDLPDEE